MNRSQIRCAISFYRLLILNLIIEIILCLGVAGAIGARTTRDLADVLLIICIIGWILWIKRSHRIKFDIRKFVSRPRAVSIAVMQLLSLVVVGLFLKENALAI